MIIIKIAQNARANKDVIGNGVFCMLSRVPDTPMRGLEACVLG